jgi:hypothetical protein
MCPELVPKAAVAKADTYARSGNLLALGERDPVDRDDRAVQKASRLLTILTRTGFDFAADDATDYAPDATFQR